MSSAKVYEFGPFRVDPTRRLLSRHDEPVSLAPKPFAVLLHFLRNPGLTLTKEQIIQAVWTDTVGSEANLSVNIAALRRALGEKPKDHRFVITVPMRGYSFVGEVRRVPARPEGDEIPLPPLGVAVSNPTRRLAVLPFEVSPPGPGGDELGAGFADAIIARMSPLRRWAVQSPQTVHRLDPTDGDALSVAHRLQAEAVLTGRIEHGDERSVVSVQVTLVEDRAVLWGDCYTMDENSMTLLPQLIAEALIRAVDQDGARPASEPPGPRHTPKLEAFQDYLLGRVLLDRADPRSITESLAQFGKAVDLDPKFALAYASTAEAHYDLWRLGLLSPSSAVPKIESAARKAIELDPNLGDPYFWIAYLNMVHYWNWPVAGALYEQGLRIAPNSCLGHTLYSLYLLLARQEHKAFAEIRAALELEPMSLFANVSLTSILRYTDRVEDALSQVQTVLEMAPDNIWGRFLYGWTLLQAGRYEEALEEYEASRQRTGEIPYTYACMGHARARMGDLEGARRHHARLMEVVSDQPLEPYIVAFSHLGMGDHDQAFAWLERAYHMRSFVLTYLSLEPLWDPLRDDPRFVDLLARIGRPGE